MDDDGSDGACTYDDVWNYGICVRERGCGRRNRGYMAGCLRTEQVNKVVFPAIDLILAVFFFAKLGTAYFDYRKHGQFEWAAPAILFACLVFTLTAPTYIWKILGI